MCNTRANPSPALFRFYLAAAIDCIKLLVLALTANAAVVCCEHIEAANAIAFVAPQRLLR